MKPWIPCSAIAALCALGLAGSAHIASDGADNKAQSAALVARPSPNNLAAAAVLAAMDDPKDRQSLDLIERSEALAPPSPEILWLHLAICERLGCDARARIAAHLQAVDPENGFAWLADLEQAQSAGPDALTAVIARMGASHKMTFYWNQLEVMVADALSLANPSQSLATRGVTAAGMLAALSLPSLQQLSKACHVEQFDLPGRRAACEAMVARMELSSTVLTQSLALSLQERWWPAGSSEREIVLAKRRRLDYLMAVSSRSSWSHPNADMALRLEAARRSDREEDVMLAMVKSLGLPAEPPAGWKDTLHPG